MRKNPKILAWWFASSFFSSSRPPKPSVETVFTHVIPQPPPHLHLLLPIQKSLQSSTDSAEVQSILSHRASLLLKPDCWNFLRLLDLLRRGPRPQLALEVFEWKRKQPKAVLDAREYTKMINLAGKLGQLKTADDLYEEMEHRGAFRTLEVENALMLAHARNSDGPKPVDSFPCSSLEQNPQSSDSAVASYSKLRHLKCLEETFEGIMEAEFRPSLQTLNCLMQGYVRLGLWWRMEEVFNLMKSISCRPNVFTFRLLIKGYAAAKLLDRMEAVYEEMVRRDLLLRGSTAEVMVAAYKKARDFEKMEKILFTIRAKRCRSKLRKCMLKAHGANGRLQSMEVLVDEAMRNGELSFSPSVARTIIKAYFKKEAYEKIDSFIEAADACSWHLNRSFYNTLMYLYGNAGLFDKMEQFFKRMLASGYQPSARTLRILSSTYQRGKAEGKADWVLHRLKVDGFDLK